MNDTKKPVLILIRGLPGSGKSYLANALEQKLGQNAVVMLDPDEADYTSEAYKAHSKALSDENVEEKFHPYRFLRAQAHKGITDGNVIIWNQAFTNLDGFTKTVINLQGYANEHHISLPLLLVEVEIDKAVAKKRVKQRASQGGHDVGDDAFARFIDDYKSFADQGHKTVIVHGEDDVNQSVDRIIAALKELL